MRSCDVVSHYFRTIHWDQCKGVSRECGCGLHWQMWRCTMLSKSNICCNYAMAMAQPTGFRYGAEVFVSSRVLVAGPWLGPVTLLGHPYLQHRSPLAYICHGYAVSSGFWLVVQPSSLSGQQRHIEGDRVSVVWCISWHVFLTYYVCVVISCFYQTATFNSKYLCSIHVAAHAFVGDHILCPP